MEHEVRQGFDPGLFALLFRVEDQHFWFRGRNRVISAVLRSLIPELPRGYRVLEVGCGTGNTLRVLERECTGAAIIGVDLYAEGLSYAAERTGAPLVQGEMNALPFGTLFDLVCLFDVLEHVADDAQVLRRLSSALKPGGRLLLTVPAYPSLWSHFDEASYHFRRYEPVVLTRTLQDSGYEIEHMTHFMAVLLPMIWFYRRLAAVSRSRSGQGSSTAADLAARELRIVPIANEILACLLRLEARWLERKGSLRWGTSLLALAGKR